MKHRHQSRRGVSRLLLYVLLALSAPGVQAADDFLDLNLREVLNLEITTASRKPQSVSQAAAAVFVITAEDIRRSPARTLPDLLRTVPGLQVASITSSSMAISARGLNGRSANKLLVLMDGRSVYSPLFSGVYWDVQDTALEDIERIEVVRGPGGTLWGANAYHGVINIITRSAASSQGTQLSLNAGDEHRFGASVVHGGRIRCRTRTIACTRRVSIAMHRGSPVPALRRVTSGAQAARAEGSISGPRNPVLTRSRETTTTAKPVNPPSSTCCGLPTGSTLPPRHAMKAPACWVDGSDRWRRV